mmetsp:Transcript_22554/g.33232  ORF Transcript_22554/g.33232 Transcript_22554/m.33232 type:complete len:107 (-) Transcript_22554:87-407(-)
MYLEDTSRVLSYTLFVKVPPILAHVSKTVTETCSSFEEEEDRRYFAHTRPEGPAPITNARFVILVLYCMWNYAVWKFNCWCDERGGEIYYSTPLLLRMVLWMELCF